MNVERFVDEFHAHRCQDPNACVHLGVDQRLGELPDPSLAWRDAQAANAKRLLQALDELPASNDFDAALDRDLARLMLEAEVFDHELQFNGRGTREQLPRAGDDIGDGIFQLSVADPRPAHERLVDISERIAAIPNYLERLLGRLQQPVARWVQMDLAKIQALPTLLSSMVRWAESASFSDRERLERRTAAACEALARYAQSLGALPTTPHVHVGPAAAAEIVRLRGIELGLGELHRIAKGFLAETGRELEELRQRLVRKYGLASDTTLARLQDALNRRFRVQVPDHDYGVILSRYRGEHQRILQFIQQRDLFPIPADQALEILATPDFMRPSIPAGAMSPPAPFRHGTATSLIFLTLSDELLDEHTELTIPIMMVHEGIPGHHLQLATAARHPSRVRRHVMANDHAEGWTTLLEDYMLDVGYAAELADEVRFCAKRDLCRIGARVAIDLFFMTGDREYLDVGVALPSASSEPFRAAGELLQTVTGFTPARVEAELNWYSLERAYPLSYLTGNHLVRRLRADLQAAARGQRAPERVDREFFEYYLRSGNMPLSFLRRVFEHRGLLPPAPRPAARG